MKKKHVHKVTINDRRRQNKKCSDMLKKGESGESLQAVFDNYYRGPLRSLYRKIKSR